MDRVSLKKYLKKSCNCFAYKALEFKKKISDDYILDIGVWFTPISESTPSTFVISVGDEVIFNAIRYKAQIEKDDVKLIALDMLEEYIKCCDFTGIDCETVPCQEFKDKYKSCDECSLLNVDCMGPMFNYPSHMNGYIKAEEKWNIKYGYKSIGEKEYLMSKFDDLICDIRFYVKDKKEQRALKKKLKRMIDRRCTIK